MPKVLFVIIKSTVELGDPVRVHPDAVDTDVRKSTPSTSIRAWIASPVMPIGGS